MKKFILGLSVCVLTFPVVAGDAFAQQANTITIIREDGSKEVIPLETAPPVPERVERAPRLEVETKPSVAPSAAPKAAPESVSEPVVPRVERVAPPVSQDKPKVVEQQPAKPAKKPAPKTVAAKRAPLDPLAIIPPRKPHRQVLPAGEVITKEKALYIALAEAPPSRDVQVYSVPTEQGSAYSVLFKTDDGMYEVLVDAASGVILSSGAVQVEHGYVKPGHLPARVVQ